MYKRQEQRIKEELDGRVDLVLAAPDTDEEIHRQQHHFPDCLLYTSDAADERSSVDLGGRRIIKKKTSEYVVRTSSHNNSDQNSGIAADEYLSR